MRSLTIYTLLTLVLCATASPLLAQEAADPYERGLEALKTSDWPTAERSFLEAVKLDPTREQVWLALSAVHAARGRILEALQAARNADELAPDQEVTLLTIGRLQAQLGAYEEAIITLDRARELHPQNAEIWMLSGLLLRDLGRVGDAISRFEEAQQRGLGGVRLLRELGFLLLDQDRSAEALDLANSALSTNPDNPYLHAIAGLALARAADRGAEAIAHLERALEQETDATTRVRLEISTLLADADRPDEALEHLAEVERSNPDLAELHFRKGRALHAAGNTEGARAALLRFQELQGAVRDEAAAAKRLGTEFNEAQQLANQNRLVEALEKVDAILAERPENARTLALRAKVLFSMQRFDDALASLVEAIRHEPASFEFAYLEGIFLLTMGRPAEAEGALVRAVALDAGRAEVYELLGQATARQAKYQLSATYFERALDLGLDSVALRLNYANVLESLGRSEEFEKQMEEYRRLRDESGS